MNATLRLFNIETRRNAAIWFVPIITGVAWWLLDSQSWTPFLWDSTNRLLQESFIPFAAPAIAGVAAWMAGRDRRRGIDDLLNSTARPATQRWFTLWGATVVWGLIAYAIYALYMMGQTASQATWGGPAFWPVAVVVLAMLAHAAWGFLLGGLFRSRFTAALVGVGALLPQLFFTQHQEMYGDGGSASTWVNEFAIQNGSSAQHALFYLGLAGAALAAIALRERQNTARFAMLTIMAALTVAGGVTIWGKYPRNDWTVVVRDGVMRVEPTSDVPRNNFGQVIQIPDWTPPEPVCEGSPVTVCTYPAYRPVLDQAILDAATMVEPLTGLPGVPNRIEDHEAGFSSGRRHAYIDITPFADKLVANDASLRNGNLQNDAQIAIRDWLLERSGWHAHINCHSLPQPFPMDLGWSTPETCAATEHFATLPETQQRAWLERHYTDLRAGKLTLDDLP